MTDIYCSYHETDNRGHKYCYRCAELRREPYRAIDRERPLTDNETIEYLSIDTGDAPCSRYGTKPAQFQPVIVAALKCQETASDSLRSVDSIEDMASLVVNDHETPARLIVTIGPNRLGLDPTAILDNSVIGEAWIGEGRAYDQANHYVAAALVDFIRSADYPVAITAVEDFLDGIELDQIVDDRQLGQAIANIVADNVERDALTTQANMREGDRS